MDRDTFQTICALLWGHHWRGTAARYLGVSLRTVMRYDAGQSPIPLDHAPALRRALHRVAREAATLAAKI